MTSADGRASAERRCRHGVAACASLLARWRERGRRWETRPYYPAILDIAGRDGARRRRRQGRRGQDRGPAERRRAT